MDIKKKWGLEICEVIPCIWLHVICRMQNVAYQCNGYKLLHRASLFTHSTQHKLINLLYGSSVSDIYGPARLHLGIPLLKLMCVVLVVTGTTANIIPAKVTSKLCTHLSGGSKGGTRLPRGPNSFILTYKFYETNPFRTWHLPLTRLAPPPKGNPISATAFVHQ